MTAKVVFLTVLTILSIVLAVVAWRLVFAAVPVFVPMELPTLGVTS